jgi:hypothetical protein
VYLRRQTLFLSLSLLCLYLSLSYLTLSVSAPLVVPNATASLRMAPTTPPTPAVASPLSAVTDGMSTEIPTAPLAQLVPRKTKENEREGEEKVRSRGRKRKR